MFEGFSVVYAYVCRPLSIAYIGATDRYPRRQYQHLSRLRRGAHKNRGLQDAFDTNGEEAIRFEVIEMCDPDLLPFLESYWIRSLKTAALRGFNLNMAAGVSLGTVSGLQRRCALSSSMARKAG
jgi:hypothetical protein